MHYYDLNRGNARSMNLRLIKPFLKTKFNILDCHNAVDTVNPFRGLSSTLSFFIENNFFYRNLALQQEQQHLFLRSCQVRLEVNTFYRRNEKTC